MIKLPDETPDALFEFCDRIYDDRSRAAHVATDLWELCLAEVQRLNATAQPVSEHNGKIADALESLLWPNMASGNKDIINEAIQALRATSAQSVSDAAKDVLSERDRQVSQEGWTPEHDDTHSSGEMAGAAACYARHVNGRQWVYAKRPEDYSSEEAPESWPWDEAWWKPKSPRKDLIRAAALIIAEIERLDRVSVNGEKDEL